MAWRVVLGTALALLAASLAVANEEDFEVDLVRGLNLAVLPAPNAHPAHGGAAEQLAHDNNSHNGGNNNNNNNNAPKSGGAKAPESQHHPAGKDAPAGKEESKHGGERKQPSKTRKNHEDDSNDDEDDDEDAEKEYLKRVKADKDAGKLPGRLKMVVPPRTVHTPLFELDSVVELQWEYDNNVIEVPEKLMISVQLPKDPHADPGSKPVLYDIAVNITGDQKKFFWDTKNDVPEGVGMREGSGYIMYFYDGDIGFRMSDVVPAGYLIKYPMPFAFYISRYPRTNDGVPRNYNPNAAGRCAPRLEVATLFSLAAMAMIQIFA
ncbi:hypothetical protein BX070DRAFT_223234 [Coemansia spiralis]|nr:hypothetical protein BX070DRAFT_223234 [Coemansia spiralis]